MSDVAAALARFPDSESVMATGDNYLIACWWRGEADRLARALYAKNNPDNVTKFEPVVVGDGYRFDPDAILEAAKGREMTTLVIIGQLPNGDLLGVERRECRNCARSDPSRDQPDCWG